MQESKIAQPMPKDAWFIVSPQIGIMAHTGHVLPERSIENFELLKEKSWNDLTKEGYYQIKAVITFIATEPTKTK